MGEILELIKMTLNGLQPLYGEIDITCNQHYTGSSTYYGSVSLPAPSGYSRLLILNVWNKQDGASIMATAQCRYSNETLYCQTMHGAADVVTVYYAWLK